MTEAQKVWSKTEKGRASIKAAQLKYRLSDKGRETRKRASDKFEKSEKRRLWTNAYRRDQRLRDQNYRFRANLRRSISKTLARQGASRSEKTIRLLGCTIDSFKIYLESLFDVGMSWDNYGTKWHIDHIIPCALFDLTKPDHQKRCFHVSNMQPMWAVENLRKGCRISS